MFKKLTILAVLIMLLVPLAGVQADSMDESAYCGDLSESDCQILLDSAAVMDELSSFAFGMNLEMDFGGDAAEDRVLLSGEGGGRLAMNLEAIEAIEANDGDDEMGAVLEALLTAVSGDVWINLSGTAAGDDIAAEINLRMKDGVILITAGAMEDLLGQPMEGLDWFGVDVTGATDVLFEGLGLASADDMSSMEASTMDHGDVDAASVTRLPDSEVNGVAVAVFETSIDLDAILSSINLADLLAANDADSEEMAESMHDIEAEDLSSRQYIGLDDHYSYRTTVSIDMTMPGESMDADEMRLTLSLEFDMWDFNLPVEVEIPADAPVFPLAMLLQMNSQ